MDIQIFSPYHSSLALNRGGFPEGLSCRHFNPIRYVVREASHPVISATAARSRRDRQKHAEYLKEHYFSKYNHLCDFVSQLTICITSGPPKLAASAPPRFLPSGECNG
jgi:hypothetical protein